MDPEIEQTPPALEPRENDSTYPTPPAFPKQDPEEPYRGLKWVFSGPEGLRAGWSILIVVSLLLSLGKAFSYAVAKFHLAPPGGAFGPRQALFGESFQLILLTLSVAIVAAIEHRTILDYNLRGPRPRDALLQRTRNWFRRSICTCRSIGCRWMAALWPGRSPRVRSPQIRRRVGCRVPSRRLL